MYRISILFFSLLTAFCSTAQSPNNFSITISEKLKLYGTIQMPANKTKPNIVLIIAGSGPTDRDCNSALGLKTNSFKMLADSLAEAGIASLRYDKRGVGDSKDSIHQEADLNIDDFINDAVAIINQLKKSNQYAKIFIAGHSEGALIGLVAAQKTNCDGYISIAGAGENIANTLSWQIKKNAAQLSTAADSIIAQLKSGKTCEVTNNSLKSIFRSSAQPYLISWMKYEPEKMIAQLQIPVMILQGTQDLQVTVSNAENLKKAQPKAKYYLIEGMNHVLKYGGTDPASNMATYNQPELPIDSDLCSAMIQFCQ